MERMRKPRLNATTVTVYLEHTARDQAVECRRVLQPRQPHRTCKRDRLEHTPPRTINLADPRRDQLPQPSPHLQLALPAPKPIGQGQNAPFDPVQYQLPQHEGRAPACLPQSVLGAPIDPTSENALEQRASLHSRQRLKLQKAAAVVLPQSGHSIRHRLTTTKRQKHHHPTARHQLMHERRRRRIKQMRVIHAQHQLVPRGPLPQNKPRLSQQTKRSRRSTRLRREQVRQCTQRDRPSRHRSRSTNRDPTQLLGRGEHLPHQTSLPNPRRSSHYHTRCATALETRLTNSKLLPPADDRPQRRHARQRRPRRLATGTDTHHPNCPSATRHAQPRRLAGGARCGSFDPSHSSPESLARSQTVHRQVPQAFKVSAQTRGSRRISELVAVATA